MSMNSQFVSVIAYVRNNADMIENFIHTVMKECEVFKSCEVIFVDDYSTDQSVEVIKQYYKANPANYVVSIIHLGKYHGMEIAMNAGRDMAIGDYVYEFDSLFVDYNGDTILDAFNKCIEGYDIVSVSTDVPIRATSRMFYKLFNAETQAHSIGQDTFRIISRRGINRICAMDVDIPYRKAIYLNCGLSVATIKYQSLTGYRPTHIAKQSERIDLAIDSFIYFTRVFQHVSLMMAGLFGLLSILTVIYTIASRLMRYHIGMGWVSTMFFMAIGFTGLFLMMALAIRYLAVLVDLVFKRQRYLISNVEKISSK